MSRRFRNPAVLQRITPRSRRKSRQIPPRELRMLSRRWRSCSLLTTKKRLLPRERISIFFPGAPNHHKTRWQRSKPLPEEMIEMFWEKSWALLLFVKNPLPSLALKRLMSIRCICSLLYFSWSHLCHSHRQLWTLRPLHCPHHLLTMTSRKAEITASISPPIIG